MVIKVILDKYSAIPEFRSNFIGEAKLVADLIHANIVQTYHLDQFQGHYFMILEFVDGINLEEFLIFHLQNKLTIPPDLAAFIISRVCRGLAYAHKKTDRNGSPLGIVHRDVNPRNILLSKEGDVKLTDFGIAKAANLMYNLEGEVIAGKDEYLSPEQAKKEVTDARADIFSCGIILSELLLGYNYFEDETDVLTRTNILKAKTPDFSSLDSKIDPILNAILHKALQKNRNYRYSSADQMLLALETYLYSDSYGPTNEKLAIYLDKLLNSEKKNSAKHFWEKSKKEKFTHPAILL